jgi:hypothetical protein
LTPVSLLDTGRDLFPQFSQSALPQIFTLLEETQAFAESQVNVHDLN